MASVKNESADLTGVLCGCAGTLVVRKRSHFGSGARKARRSDRGALSALTEGDRSPDEVLGEDGEQTAGQVDKCTRGMPRYEPAMKDVASCEKLRGAASKHRSGDVRMGKPGRGYALSSRKGSQPGELKHLSTRRKRNQK